jgi:hypothetical protein
MLGESSSGKDLHTVLHSECPRKVRIVSLPSIYNTAVAIAYAESSDAASCCLPSKWLCVAFTAINWATVLRRQMHFLLVLLEISSQVCAIIAAVIIANLARSVPFDVSTVTNCQRLPYFGDAFDVL